LPDHLRVAARAERLWQTVIDQRSLEWVDTMIEEDISERSDVQTFLVDALV
jgi:hypothetical protein